MPRGVAIDGARQRLFEAAEAVILRAGVDGLTGRAVTAQAGVATGLLHAHFGDFEGFLAAYVVDRSFLLTTESGNAAGRKGDVAEEVCSVLAGLSQPASTALARLLAARPGLRGAAAEVLGDGAAGFEGVIAVVADRLASGAIRPGVDAGAMAYGIVGAALWAWCAGDSETRWRSAVAALLAPALPR
ncbi:TetR/AcrR family transcriptional regulator [Tsukamurella sp. NPDC003166]|uniref:TetR/AcrR family transcriptional regulator n=1 Tax=Tsukamurella sp. NPDC003166 TaxID=3154444 RepID=UPI0033BB39D1